MLFIAAKYLLDSSVKEHIDSIDIKMSPINLTSFTYLKDFSFKKRIDCLNKVQPSIATKVTQVATGLTRAIGVVVVI